MSSVRTPTSVTDPYAPEPSTSAPVRIRLTALDGSSIELLETSRVLTSKQVVRLDGKSFLYRGTSDRGTRLYIEVPVLDLNENVAVHFSRDFLRELLLAHTVAEESKATDRREGKIHMSLATHKRLDTVMRLRAAAIAAVEAAAKKAGQR